jgi:hypothetical protein
MTLFYGTDDEWVAWTEEGFFDASPNGARYVGYHINRGEDRAADYVGVDQMYDLFYRPDLVAKRIKGGFEKEIKAELARIGNIDEIIASGLPPEVTILTDNNARINQRDFTLYFSLKDKGGGIGRVEYRVNDVLVASTEDIRSEGVYTQRRSGRIPKHFTLPGGTNKVTVTTYNKKGTIASEPAQITVHVKDPLKGTPELYVLAVGVSEYRDRNLWLKFAHTDAQDVAEELENRGKGLFSDVHVMHLVNKEATTSAIEKTFDNLSKKIKTSDVFVLYLAGHGMAVSGRYHFIPWEAVYDTTSEALAQASLSHDKIIGLLEKIPALKSLIILDTCYAGMAAKLGSQVKVASLRGIEEKTAIDKLMRTSGRTFLAASSENQPAIEGYKGHGVFTFALIQGLKGQADRKGRGEGVITIDELADYVRQEVPKITSKKWGYEIIPMRNIMGDPFPIGCRQGVQCRP